jgi:hypothetical protein
MSSYSHEEIVELLSDYEAQIEALKQKANALVQGRSVEIIGDWNGQPHGTSRPSRRGQVLTAKEVSLSGYWSGVTITEYEYDAPPYLRDVRFVDI